MSDLLNRIFERFEKEKRSVSKTARGIELNINIAGSEATAYLQQHGTVAVCLVTLDAIEIPVAKYFDVMELMFQVQHKADPTQILLNEQEGMLMTRSIDLLDDGDLDDDQLDLLLVKTVAAAGMIGAKVRAVLDGLLTPTQAAEDSATDPVAVIEINPNQNIN